MIVFLTSRHESWWDEWHVWYMCKTLSVEEIFKSMVEEGHFALWHLMVLPLVKLGWPYYSMFLLSCTLSAVAAWLLLFKSDFPVWLVLIILCSGPMIYYFSVISRCYSIIPPLIIILALLYRNLPKHNYLFCILLGLMAHTHAYMEGFVAAVFLIYVYDYVLKPYQKNKKIKIGEILPPVLTVLIVCMAVVQVIGSLSVASDLNGSMTPGSLEAKFSNQYRMAFFSEILAPTTFSFFHYKFFYFVDVISDCIVKASFFFAFISIFIKRNKKVGLILLVSVFYQLCFAVFIYGMSMQRAYFPFLILLFGAICSYHSESSLSRGIYTLLVTLSMLVSLNHNYRDALLDISTKHPFSNARLINSYINENGDNILVLCPMSPITEYNDAFRINIVPNTSDLEFKDVVSEIVNMEKKVYFVDVKQSDIGHLLGNKFSVKQISGFKEDKSFYESWYLYEISIAETDGNLTF